MQGHLDVPLDETGTWQARALATRLRNLPADALYSSDLKRAAQTAETLAEATGLSIEWDERLRERHLGQFQGKTLPEVEAIHPEAYGKFIQKDPGYYPPGGESYVQMENRILPFLADVVERHGGHTVVVVTHGGVLGIIFRHVLGIPLGAPIKFKRANTSLSQITHHRGDWILVSWGDVCHLNHPQRGTVSS